MNPHALAVADNRLRVGLHIHPTKFARPREFERAARVPDRLSLPIDNLLRESGARRLRAVHERIQAIDARGERDARVACEQRRDDGPNEKRAFKKALNKSLAAERDNIFYLDENCQLSQTVLHLTRVKCTFG